VFPGSRSLVLAVAGDQLPATTTPGFRFAVCFIESERTRGRGHANVGILEMERIILLGNGGLWRISARNQEVERERGRENLWFVSLSLCTPLISGYLLRITLSFSV